MLRDRSAEVLGPVFTSAGGDDAPVKEEVQGPRQGLQGPRDTFQGAVCGNGEEGVRSSLLSRDKSVGTLHCRGSWFFSGHTEREDILA